MPGLGGDRHLHGLPRDPVPAPGPAVHAARRSAPRRASPAGFLDPLIGTALLTVIGIAAGRSAGRDAARSGSPSTGARAGWRGWSSRASRSSPGRRTSCSRCSGCRSSSSALFAPLSFRAEGGGVYGRSFIAAGAMMSLIALPPAVRGHARRAAGGAGAHARGGLRPGQDAHRDDPQGAAAERALEHRHRRDARRSAASSATRRSCCCCWARRCTSKRRARCPGLNVLRGTGSTLTTYVYDNSPGRRRRGAAEGLRGGVRAAGVRARPEPARGPDRPLSRAERWACRCRAGRSERRMPALRGDAPVQASPTSAREPDKISDSIEKPELMGNVSDES